MSDKTYFVELTEPADEQVRQIGRYIKNVLKNPDAATNLLKAIEDAASSLSQMPYRFAMVHPEPWRSNGIHIMPVKKYSVYFWIDEDNDKVHITAIIASNRDQRNQLMQMSME